MTREPLRIQYKFEIGEHVMITEDKLRDEPAIIVDRLPDCETYRLLLLDGSIREIHHLSLQKASR